MMLLLVGDTAVIAVVAAIRVATVGYVAATYVTASTVNCCFPVLLMQVKLLLRLVLMMIMW